MLSLSSIHHNFLPFFPPPSSFSPSFITSNAPHHPIHSKSADSRSNMSGYWFILPYLIISGFVGCQILIYLLPSAVFFIYSHFPSYPVLSYSIPSSIHPLQHPPLPSTFTRFRHLGRHRLQRGLLHKNEVLLHCHCCCCRPHGWPSHPSSQRLPCSRPATSPAGGRRRLATPRCSDEPARGAA